MAKRYKIIGEFDPSQPIAAADRMAAAFARAEQRMASAMKAGAGGGGAGGAGGSAGAGGGAGTRAQFQSLESLRNAGLKLQSDLINAAMDREAKEVASAQRSADAQAAAAEKKAVKLSAIEDSYLAKDWRRTNAYQRMKSEAADRAARDAEDRQKRLSERIGQALGGAALAAVAMLADHYEKIRENAEKAAAATAKMIVDLREKAGVENKAGPGLADVGEVGQVMAVSGLPQAAAAKFLTDWRNASGVATDAFKQTGGRVGWAESMDSKIRDAVAQTAARMNLPTDMVTELASMIGTVRKIEKPADVVEQIGAMSRIASEGVGAPGKLLGAGRELMAKMVTPGAGGFVGSPAELQAAVSSMSKFASSPEEAATRVEQLQTLALTGSVRFRKMRGLPFSMADWFKKLRIPEEATGMEQVLDPLIEDIKANAGPNIRAYVARQGVTDVGQQQALESLARGENYALFKGLMGKARGQVAAGQATGLNQQFPTTPGGREMFQQAGGELTEMAEGVRVFALRQMMEGISKTPEWRQRQQGTLTPFNELFAGMFLGNLNPYNIVMGGSREAGRRAILENEAVERAMSAATEAGVGGAPLEKAMEETGIRWEAGGLRIPANQPFAAADFLNRLAELMKAQGASLPFGKPEEAGVRALTTQLSRTAAAVEGANTRADRAETRPDGPRNAPPGGRLNP